MCKSPSVVFLNLICRDLEPTFHLTYQSKKVRMLHTNYTLLALCDYFLSHFLIIFLEFVRLFLFVTLYNDFFQKSPKRAGEAFLSHYVIKTGIITNLNSIQISTVFSFQKCQERRRLYFTFLGHFWANLAQKFKILCLWSNLEPRIIRLCKIRWWCSPFLFQTRNTLFEQI